MYTGWVINNKHVHPNFDWIKANYFQLKAAATDGNDVIPNITEKAYETTPETEYQEYVIKRS